MESQFGAPYTFEESSQDPVRPVGYVCECRVNGLRGQRFWTPLLENYINGKCAIDITLGKGPFLGSMQSDMAKYRILLYWPDFCTFQNLLPERAKNFWERKPEFLDHGPCELDGAVLVGVREFTEMPERALDAIPCAAIIRREQLFGSDHGDGSVTDPVQKLHSTPIKSLHRFEDWELDLGADWRRLSVTPNEQLVDEVIETRPKVVDDLADFDAPHWIGLAPDFGPHDEFLKLSVILDPWHVRVTLDEGCKFSLECVDLTPCPFTFEPYPD